MVQEVTDVQKQKLQAVTIYSSISGRGLQRGTSYSTAGAVIAVRYSKPLGRSFRLDVSRLDDHAPLLALLLDRGQRFSRAAAGDDQLQIGEPGPGLRLL